MRALGTLRVAGATLYPCLGYPYDHGWTIVELRGNLIAEK
jgi:hypothetical protein